MQEQMIHPQTYTLLKGKQAPIYYKTEGVKKEKAKQIIDAICRYYKVTEEQLKSKNRKRLIVLPRQVCMYIIKVKTKLKDDAIAEMFNRDRTTSIHSIDLINNFLNQGHPVEIVEQINEIKRLLSNI